MISHPFRINFVQGNPVIVEYVMFFRTPLANAMLKFLVKEVLPFSWILAWSMHRFFFFFFFFFFAFWFEEYFS